MKMLIIRPESGASASAKRAREEGFEPILLPFFKVTSRGWVAPDPAAYHALLITSSNAMRHGGADLARLSTLPVLAVGNRSAMAATQQGFSVAITGEQGIEALLGQAETAGYRRLLWLAGEDRRAPLIPQNMRINIQTVYASDPVPLPANAAETIASADIVALHSPRAAQLFGEAVDSFALDRGTISLVAFSAAIAKAAGHGWGGVATGTMPEDSALLSAASELVRQCSMAKAGKTLS